MNNRRIVVVGGGAAGMAAASRAKRVDPTAIVKVFETSSHVSYGACGIPYYIGGLVSDVSKLVSYWPKQFKEERGIDVSIRTEVKTIDPRSRTLRCIGQQGEIEEQFDSLILATGAKPAVPNFRGMELEGIHVIRWLEDAEKKASDLGASKEVTIIGAGYIGLELSESFRRLGKQVTILELLPRPLPNVDVEVSELVKGELESGGVRLKLNEKVLGFEGRDRVEKVITESGSHETDLVVLATGVKPNVDLASMMGIQLGTTGAIKVDETMRTNLDQFLAAGDNVETRHLVTGLPTYMPFAQTANKMGYVAGANAGGSKEIFRGVMGSAITKIFGLEIGRTGLSEAEAKIVGMQTRGVLIRSRTRAGYYPDSKEIWVKLILNATNNVIVGAQVAGREGVWGRIATLTLAILNKATPKQLFFYDLPYAPPFGPVWDPLIVSARVAMRQ